MVYHGHPQLMRHYMTFADIRTNAMRKGIIDLGSVKFLTPTTLLPLSIAMKKALGKMRYIPPSDMDVQAHLSVVQDEVGYDKLNKQTYLPIVGLPKSVRQSRPILSKIYQLGGDIGGKNAFRYLVGELVDNIYQHSMFENAMVMAQRYTKNREMHLCIIDDGITIGGSLGRAGLIMEDHQAITDALQGASAKKDKERGKGLGTSLSLMIKGYHGKMLVVSGRGAVHLGDGAPLIFQLSDMFKYEGTLISMIIPFIDTEVDVYDHADL